VQLSLSQIAKVLNGEVRGNQVAAPGPGHSPKDRSLSVTLNDAGDDVIVNTFSPADDRMALLKYVREKCGILPRTNGTGRRPSDEDMTAIIQAAVASQRKPMSSGALVATYDYKDQGGMLLYQVCRYEPKRFGHRQPDGHGGWLYRGSHRRVVYRWPDLIAYPDATVFVCEGEKDADNIAALDLCATTVASGKWTDDCVNALAGRDCWIMEDCDDAGRTKALDAAQKLHGVAKSIKIVRLPGLGEGGDVSDWLDAGRTKDELFEVCASTAEWDYSSSNILSTPPSVSGALPAPVNTKSLPAKIEAAPPPLVFLNVAAWDDMPVPEQAWSVHNRFPSNQAVLFSGEGAAGKSTIYLHLAGAHVLGKDWLGGLPEPGKALFIEAEDDASVMHRRLSHVASHFGTTFGELAKEGLHLISLAGQDAVIATATRSGKIEPPPLYKQFLEAAGDIKPKMIGIASSANVYAGSEIDRSQVQQFISLLTRLAMLANGTCHLISHPSLTGINTDTGLSGNTAWHNAVRARCYLRSVKPEAGEQPDNDLRELTFKKNNYGPVAETVILKYRDGLFLPLRGVGSLDKVAAEAKAEDVFLALLKRFASTNRNASDRTGTTYAPALFVVEDEAKRAGLNKKNLEAAMRRLFQAGKIWNEPYDKPSLKRFRLAVKV
jgi:RecA-family ATPase